MKGCNQLQKKKNQNRKEARKQRHLLIADKCEKAWLWTGFLHQLAGFGHVCEAFLAI